MAGKIREAYAKHVRPEMQHHNMAFAGDATSLEKAMEENHALHPHKTLEVKRALEEGDLVAVHSHIQRGRICAGGSGEQMRPKHFICGLLRW